MRDQCTAERYGVRLEPAPAPKPNWWRSMWEVVDHQTGRVVDKLHTWGAANQIARCLNRPGDVVCRGANPKANAAEVWGWAA
jgi:hypothetical protein